MTVFSRLRCIFLFGALSLAGFSQNSKASPPSRANDRQLQVVLKSPTGKQITHQNPVPASHFEKCAKYDDQFLDCDVASARAAVDQSKYAFAQMLLSALGFATGLGVFFVAIIAAKWARKAAEETRAGAAAAVEAVNESRSANRIAEQALRSNRPWLGPLPFEKMTFKSCMVNDHPVSDSFGFMMKWTNWGESPAVDVSYGFDYKFVPIKDQHIENFTDVFNLSAPTGFVGPGQQVTAGQVGFRQYEVDKFRSGETALFIVARSAYRDAREPTQSVRHVTTNFVCVTHIGGIVKGVDGIQDEIIRIEIRKTIAT